MIAIPSLSGSYNSGLTRFVTATMLASAINKSYPWHFTFTDTNGLTPVEWARNSLVGEFLRSEADRLWFIDDDMYPHPETLQLLHVDADIVGGRAFIWDAPNEEHGPRLRLSAFAYNLIGDSKFHSVVPQIGQGEGAVDAVGTATMLIRRRVLEDRRLWLPTKYVDFDGSERDLLDEQSEKRWGPPIFRIMKKPNGCPLRGEDLDFCLRARELGYTVRFHAGVGAGHMKIVNLDDIASLVHDAIGDAVRMASRREDKPQGAKPAPALMVI